MVIELPETIEEGVVTSETTGTGFGDGVFTETIVEFVADPPVPEQEIVYVVLAVGVTICVPDVGFVPVQPTLPVQVVALVETQVSVAELPATIDDGSAEIETVGIFGGGTLPTVTVTVLFALPPVPVQVSVYAVVVLGTTTCVPEVPFVPVNVPPVAVQVVELVETQVSVLLPPAVTVVGDAERETVGVLGGGEIVVFTRLSSTDQPSGPVS